MGTNRGRRSLAVLTAAGVLLGVLGLAPAPAAAATCDLTPQLRLFEASQGGPYAQLARGKDTFVTFFLALPSCAPSTASIQVKSSKLSVTTPAGTTTGIVARNNPTGTTYPKIASATATPTPGSGNPVFLVPPQLLSAPDPKVPYDAAMTADITYIAKTSSTASGVEGTVQRAGTAKVDRATEPLRVLLVPMGVSEGAAPQLSTRARDAAVGGLSTVSRVLPLAEGVGPIGSPNTGLQYEWNPTVVDVGPDGANALDPDGKFCGTASRFDRIELALLPELAKWNALHPTTPADRVVGVIDQLISKGASAACDEGRARIAGLTAWVRALHDATTSPLMTGALLTMELSHSWGLVQRPAGHVGAWDYHSTAAQADTSFPGRGWNLGTRQLLTDARSVMRGTGGWNDGNVLFEPPHWDATMCSLGGASAGCINGSVPVATTAAAAARIVVVGTITATGTASTAEVADSYFDGDSRQQPPAEASRWELRQLSGTNPVPVRVDPVPVRFDRSGHEGAEPAPAQTGSFDVSWPAEGDRFQLVDTESGAVLYERTRDTAPTFVDVEEGHDAGSVTLGSARNLSASPLVTDASPALSGTGLAAWTGGGQVLVAPADGASPPVAVPGVTSAAAVALTADGSVLAVERNGSIDLFDVGRDTAGALTFTNERRVYNAGPAPVPLIAAHHPTFASYDPAVPSSLRLAIEVAGSIYTVDPNPAPGVSLDCVLPQVVSRSCKRITTAGGDSQPSWAPYGSHLAFTRGGSVWTVDTRADEPGQPAGSPVQLVAGTNPSYGAGHLTFTRGGEIWVADPASPTVAGQTARPLVTGPGHGASAIRWNPGGGTVVYARTEGTTVDIFSAAVSPVTPPPESARVLHITVRDENPANARLAVLLVCGAKSFPLVAGLRPFDLQGTTARFRFRWNPEATPGLACGGGRFDYEANDGYLTTLRGTGGGAGTDPKPPVVVVRSPEPGSQTPAGQKVTLEAEGTDAEQGPLPSSAFRWTVGTETLTGDHVDVVRAPGTYTATVTATDSTGRTATASTSFTVLPPNPPVPVITSPVSGSSHPSGATIHASGSASDVEDGDVPASALAWRLDGPCGAQVFDGVSSFDVTPACVGRFTLTLETTDNDGNVGRAAAGFTLGTPASAVVDFDPDTLYVPPLPSEPQTVTVYVTVPGRDVTQVASSSVQITRIGGIDVSTDPRFKATAWSVRRGVATAKFDRRTLTDFLDAHGLVDQRVPVHVAGSAPSWFFEGADSPDVRSH